MPQIAPSHVLTHCALPSASGCAPAAARETLSRSLRLGSVGSGLRDVAAAAQAAPGGPAVRQDARRRRWRQLLCGGQARAGRQPVWRNPAAPRPGAICPPIAAIGAPWEAATARHPCRGACSRPAGGPICCSTSSHVLQVAYAAARRVQGGHSCRIAALPAGGSGAPLTAPAARYWLLNSLSACHSLLHALQARKWESWEGPWCVRCHIGPWFGRWSPGLPLLLHASAALACLTLALPTAASARCPTVQVLHPGRGDRHAGHRPLGPPRQQPDVLGGPESGREQGLCVMAPAMLPPLLCRPTAGHWMNQCDSLGRDSDVLPVRG